MSVYFTPFHIEHLRSFVPAQGQESEFRALSQPQIKDGLGQCLALSAWASGAFLGAAGIGMHWQGRGEVWALLSPNAGRYMLPLALRMKKVLFHEKIRRMEYVIKEGNHCSMRLARLLGFEYEGNVYLYFPDGANGVRYVRINK
jgi:hypothetical protein